MFIGRILLVVSGIFAAVSVSASPDVALADKPLFGLSYDIAMMPAVDRILHNDIKADLRGLHRGALEMYYPLNRYLNVGISIDYTLALSNKDGNPLLDVAQASKKLSSTYLGVSPRIRPQIPFAFESFDVIVYTEAQVGLGTSSPIAFGTQPLTNFSYAGADKIPTPFPLMFEATPKLGIELFGWRFIGLDVAFGYRSLWIVHPMVKVPADRRSADMPKEGRKAVWYDITAPFVQASVKFAF